MPFLTNTIPANPDKILVIDDIPLISIAFQEIFRSVNTRALVEYTDNIFTPLSSRAYRATEFDLIIIGSVPDMSPTDLSEPIGWLKDRFPKARIMIYTTAYDPTAFSKIGEWGIDAYIHKYEAPEEIRKAYLSITSGEPYISGIFRTLFSGYGATRKDTAVRVDRSK